MRFNDYMVFDSNTGEVFRENVSQADAISLTSAHMELDFALQDDYDSVQRERYHRGRHPLSPHKAHTGGWNPRGRRTTIYRQGKGEQFTPRSNDVKQKTSSVWIGNIFKQSNKRLNIITQDFRYSLKQRNLASKILTRRNKGRRFS